MQLPILQSRLPVLVVVGTVLALTSACVGNDPPFVEGTVVVSNAPPPRVYEVRPASPGVDFIWIEGYHRWDGAAYQWVPGHWEHRPRPHARWKNGKWKHSDRGWYWQDGRWEGGDDDHDQGHGRGRRPDRH